MAVAVAVEVQAVGMMVGATIRHLRIQVRTTTTGRTSPSDQEGALDSSKAGGLMGGVPQLVLRLEQLRATALEGWAITVAEPAAVGITMGVPGVATMGERVRRDPTPRHRAVLDMKARALARRVDVDRLVIPDEIPIDANSGDDELHEANAT